MIIKNGAITKGAPEGKNKFTNFQLYAAKAIILIPINIVKPAKKVITAKLVLVKLKGIIPIKLLIAIKTNMKTYNGR
jgi:hypothetical protein